ncbi:MAG: GAF domain-containing protein [Gemmatimonadaceae bacterium]
MSRAGLGHAISQWPRRNTTHRRTEVTAWVTQVVEELERIVTSKGMHAGLEFLNRRSSHRFSGVYRFDVADLRNLYLYDRENPTLQLGTDQPLHETYCSIVGRTGQTFYTSDARTDARTADHPARESVISYCGALLSGPDGPFGSLCNFDLIPRPTTPSEILVLEAAAPVVMATIIATRAGGWS